MDEPVLLVRVERLDESRVRVLSPDVGLWSDHPHLGALLGPGSKIGILARLTRRAALLLPDGTAGVVSGPLPRDRSVAVEYGQLLFELSPVGGAAWEQSVEADAGRLGHPVAADLPAGARAIVSPTDGTFYHRPAADAPPFVQVGGTVRRGQAIGLVEVMKTFNHVLYGGPGFPDEAQVVEVRCGDAEEVRAGQVLVVVR